jgi:hypothetical protein
MLRRTYSERSEFLYEQLRIAFSLLIITVLTSTLGGCCYRNKGALERGYSLARIRESQFATGWIEAIDQQPGCSWTTRISYGKDPIDNFFGAQNVAVFGSDTAEFWIWRDDPSVPLKHTVKFVRSDAGGNISASTWTTYFGVGPPPSDPDPINAGPTVNWNNITSAVVLSRAGQQDDGCGIETGLSSSGGEVVLPGDTLRFYLLKVGGLSPISSVDAKVGSDGLERADTVGSPPINYVPIASPFTSAPLDVAARAVYENFVKSLLKRLGNSYQLKSVELLPGHRVVRVERRGSLSELPWRRELKLSDAMRSLFGPLEEGTRDTYYPVLVETEDGSSGLFYASRYDGIWQNDPSSPSDLQLLPNDILHFGSLNLVMWANSYARPKREKRHLK